MKKKSSRPDQVLYILFFGKNKKMTFGHGLFFLCRFPEFIFFPFPQSCPSLLPVWLFDYYWHVVDGWLESCDPNRSQGRSHFGRKSNPHHHHHQRKQADFVPSVIWEGNILFFKYKNKKTKNSYRRHLVRIAWPVVVDVYQNEGPDTEQHETIREKRDI